MSRLWEWRLFADIAGCEVCGARWEACLSMQPEMQPRLAYEHGRIAAPTLLTLRATVTVTVTVPVGIQTDDDAWHTGGRQPRAWFCLSFGTLYNGVPYGVLLCTPTFSLVQVATAELASVMESRMGLISAPSRRGLDSPGPISPLSLERLVGRSNSGTQWKSRPGVSGLPERERSRAVESGES